MSRRLAALAALVLASAPLAALAQAPAQKPPAATPARPSGSATQ